jgi:hypothetical protein
MDDDCYLDADTLLTGTLTIRAIGRADGRPRRGLTAKVRGCGFA